MLFESLRCSISRFITTKLGKFGKSYEALLLCLVGHLYLRFNYVPMKKMNLRSLCRRRRTAEDHLCEMTTAEDYSMADECPWTTQGSLQKVKAVRKSVVVKWWGCGEPDGMNNNVVKQGLEMYEVFNLETLCNDEGGSLRGIIALDYQFTSGTRVKGRVQHASESAGQACMQGSTWIWTGAESVGHATVGTLIQVQKPIQPLTSYLVERLTSTRYIVAEAFAMNTAVGAIDGDVNQAIDGYVNPGEVALDTLRSMEPSGTLRHKKILMAMAGRDVIDQDLSLVLGWAATQHAGSLILRGWTVRKKIHSTT